MKNLSDEELVLNYCISCMEFDRDTDVPPEGVKKNMLLQKELLSRLERGRKAMEAMEKIKSIIDEQDAYATDKYIAVREINNDYQQSEEAEG